MLPKPRALMTCLHFLGLAAFAMVPPILFTLANTPAFFLVHGADARDVVAFTAIFSLGIPFVFAATATGLAMLGTKIYQVIWPVTIALLLSLVLMGSLNRVAVIPDYIVPVLSVCIAILGSYLTMRVPATRTALTLLVPVALLTPTLFVLQSKIAFPENTGERSLTQSSVTRDTPVFVVLFDEFSTHTLFDEEREIDAEHFPNFARLARDGIWFRNATTVADFTINAIPAILTGRYVGARYDSTPTYDNYPENIFTILHQAGYDVYAFEALTQLCPDAINRNKTHRTRSRRQILASIFEDVWIIAGHLFLPEDMRRGLPSIEGRIAHFADEAKHATTTEAERLIENFHELIDATRNRLYVLHAMIPHSPYLRLPSGARYVSLMDRRFDLYSSPGYDWNKGDSPEAQQRYMLFAGYADSLIGRLIQRFEEVRLYDDALIVVLADHGVSFRPGSPRRFVIEEGEGVFRNTDAAIDILKAPLFMKLPGASSKGIRDEPVQTIDVLPTVLAALGIDATDRFDGRDVLAEDVTPLVSYRFYSGDRKEYRAHNLDIMSPTYDANRMRRLLDPSRFYAVRNRWDALLDRAVTEFGDVGTSELRASISVPEQYDNVDFDSGYVPAMVRGFTQNNAEEGEVPAIDAAIVLNGVIAALVRTHPAWFENKQKFQAVIEPSALRKGANTVEFYEVDANTDGSPRLLRPGHAPGGLN